MNCSTIRQRITLWLVFRLPPEIRFHRPTRSTVPTAASAIRIAQETSLALGSEVCEIVCVSLS
jgi:hypothetical protein